MTTILKNLGFEQADRTIYPRLVMSLKAMEGEGKTHFGLSAPGDIAMLNMDLGLEGVIQKFPDKKIDICHITLPEDKNDIDWASVKGEWDKFLKAYRGAFQIPTVRTVLVDTATEAYELIRLARFGQLSQVMPYMYGPVNAEFRSLIRMALKSPIKNLIMIHRMRSVYINDKRTKDWERAGFTGAGYDFQVEGHLWKELVEDDEPVFHITITKCRINPSIEGVDYSGPMCSFPFIACEAMPGTKVSDWE